MTDVQPSADADLSARNGHDDGTPEWAILEHADPEVIADEAEASGFDGMTPPTEEELATAAELAAATRRNLVEQAERTRPLTDDEIAANPVARLLLTAEGREELEADAELEALGPIPRSLADITEPDDVDASYAAGVLGPGRVCVMAGPPGAGKSVVVEDLALCMAASGRRWLGEFETSPAVVLLVNAELDEREMWKREASLLAHHGLTRKDVTRLYRVDRPGMDLRQEAWIQWLARWIDRLGANVVILDPFGEVHAAEEKREHLKPVLDALLGLRVGRPNLAFVIAHHTRKRPPGQGDGRRGVDDVRGAYLADRADVIVMLEPLGDRRLRLSLSKRTTPRELILEQDPDTLVFTAVADVRSADDERLADRVIAAIDAGATSVDELEAALGKSRASIYRAIRELRQQQVLETRGPLRRRFE